MRASFRPYSLWVPEGAFEALPPGRCISQERGETNQLAVVRRHQHVVFSCRSCSNSARIALGVRQIQLRHVRWCCAMRPAPAQGLFGIGSSWLLLPALRRALTDSGR